LVRRYVDSYESVHQEERLLLLRDREPPPRELADELEPQARDLEIIRALWRYRFLLTSQIAREWWPGKSLWATQKRLRRLTAAGWVSRFRPRLSKGKHEWVYELARKGFELGRNYRGLDGFYIPKEAKWRPRRVSDYRLVLHDLQVNAWVMAYRRLVGEEIADWLGPEQGRIDVPTRYEDRRFKPMTMEHARQEAPERVYVHDLRLDTFARVVPDATLRLELDDPERRIELLVELDRTARPTKNVDKLRRYDALITAWWRGSDRYRGIREPPNVVFVCRDRDQAMALMRIAHHEVTGQHGRYSGREGRSSPRRDRMLFVAEREIHDASLAAWMLSPHPPIDGWPEEFWTRDAPLPGTPLFDPLPF
jgi:Replication-relaxation